MIWKLFIRILTYVDIFCITEQTWGADYVNSIIKQQKKKGKKIEKQKENFELVQSEGSDCAWGIS